MPIVRSLGNDRRPMSSLKKRTPANRTARRNKKPMTRTTIPDDAALAQFAPSESRLVSLRHHSALWLAPALLLTLALLP